MDNQGNKRVARDFAAAFAGALGDALAGTTGVLWPLQVLNGPNAPTQRGTPIQFRLSAEGELSGECFVEFNEPQILALLSKIFKAPVHEFTNEHNEGFSKFLASAAEKLVASELGEYGQSHFRVERVAGLAFGGMFVVPVACSEESSDLQVLLYFGGEFLESLWRLQDSPGAGNESVVPSQNLNMVMDVELNVSLRFGQRQLPLHEVLDLASGSVIELDRMADEPVELYLDGKLIARGEAVVVDGNYGLRVTEILQPAQSYLVN